MEVKMAKLTAWLTTLVGVVLVLVAAGVYSINDAMIQWAVAVAVLVIGLGKLMRNYSSRKK